jgi:hypothetical protein
VLGGPTPFVSHLVNILLHILVVFLVFFVGARWSKDPEAAFLASILFAVHPAHAAAVAYVSGRADPLATIFCLVGFWLCCLVRGARRSLGGWIGVACLIAALLCRESAIIFPFLCVAYGILTREKLSRPLVGAMAAVVLIYVALRSFVPNLTPISYGATSFSQRLPGMFRVIYESLRVLVWPMGLHMEYGRPIFSWMDAGVMTGLVATGVFIFCLVRFWRKDPAIAFGAVWF